jgi:hypothetical protein
MKKNVVFFWKTLTFERIFTYKLKIWIMIVQVMGIKSRLIGGDFFFTDMNSSGFCPFAIGVAPVLL